jgi:hypothetical protein
VIYASTPATGSANHKGAGMYLAAGVGWGRTHQPNPILTDYRLDIAHTTWSERDPRDWLAETIEHWPGYVLPLQPRRDRPRPSRSHAPRRMEELMTRFLASNGVTVIETPTYITYQYPGDPYKTIHLSRETTDALREYFTHTQETT